MENTENVLIETPCECPLRFRDSITDKYFCGVVNVKRETIRCPDSRKFPDNCQLADKNICIMRGR